MAVVVGLPHFGITPPATRRADAKACRRYAHLAGPDESAEDHQPTRSGPVRPATTPYPTTRATPAGRPGPLHPTPLNLDARVGGDAAEVLAAVGRRLDVGSKLAALVLVAEAVENDRAGRRDRDAPADR